MPARPQTSRSNNKARWGRCVPATSRPSPGLNFPSRRCECACLPETKCKRTRRPANRSRKSSSECAPQFFRQIGNAFMKAVAKMDEARLVKNVSPAAIGKTAPTNRSWQNSAENDGIEMTGMVRHEHKRRARRQIFAAANFESMRDGKINARDRSPKKTRDRAFQSDFAAQTRRRCARAQSEDHAPAQNATLPSLTADGKNPRRLIEPEAAEISRCNETPPARPAACYQNDRANRRDREWLRPCP